MAYECLDCGLINVFPSKTGDGNRCIKCDGCIVPIGYAVINKPIAKINNIEIGIQVDTTELDNALDKARELESIIDGLKRR